MSPGGGVAGMLLGGKMQLNRNEHTLKMTPKNILAKDVKRILE